ncbi:MAG: Hsp20/alpha crystallin family protein [Streptosporangiaceae bacterium]|jgi:HSP20 family molecular chaperone IbpA
MSALTRRDSHGLFPAVLEWLEPSLAVLRPFTAQMMPVEEYVENGRYVVRAELPGIDPETQADVTVSRGILTIHAERHEDTGSKHHSEFRYGSFTRHVVLPASVDESDIRASYDSGILEVSLGLMSSDQEHAAWHVPIRVLQHIKPT